MKFRHPLRHPFIAFALLSAFFLARSARADAAESTAPVQLANQNGRHTLLVEGQPFLILGGELYNSSSSSADYMDGVWPTLAASGINTVLANVSWNQFEPEPGRFDTTLIDSLLLKAQEHDLRLIILWFGSWKNGESSYAPLWVRRDLASFPRVVSKQGEVLETLSVFGEKTRAADRRAFTALMKRIREKDVSHRVIMVQIQNEVGLLGSDFDYGVGAAVPSQPVPPKLLDYLATHRDQLRPETRRAWTEAGARTAGSWLEVFGDTPSAREFALAWHYATFINELAEAGRKEIDLPVFVNAWIVQNDRELPGDYPAGGPVSRVMDIYKAAAPAIDLMAPDIYLADFKGITADYVRADNPLFVPESTFDAGRAFYAIGQHAALGYSPFGIDDIGRHPSYGTALRVLGELAPLLHESRRVGRPIRGVLRQGNETGDTLELDDVTLTVRYPRADLPAYGLVIRTERDEFVIAGVNLIVEFKSRDSARVAKIAEVHDGQFARGQWKPGRLLNGDDTFHNAAVRVYGRSWINGPTFKADADLPPQPTVANAVNAPAAAVASAATAQPTPGIYHVKLYWR